MNNISQHYDITQRKFLNKIQYKIKNLEDNNGYYQIGFCDISQIKLINELCANLNFNIEFYSLNEPSERKFCTISTKDFLFEKHNLYCVEIKYNNKFNKITHPHVLGTVLNSEINYDNIGDILVDLNDNVQVITTLDGFYELQASISQINNCSIKFQITEDVIKTEKNFKFKSFNINSNRLDLFVKNFINKNRDYAKNEILSRKVKLNQVITNSPTKTISKYDIISIRGYGRFEVLEIKIKQNNKTNVTIKY